MVNKSLYEILLDNGFTNVVTPISKVQNFLNYFLPSKRKHKPMIYDFWLERLIDNIKYEVCFDEESYKIDIENRPLLE